MVMLHPINTIVSKPDIRNGQLLIADSRVRVLDVVASHLYRGLNAGELATNFALSLGQVYAALAYYYQNKATFDALLREEAKRADAHLETLDQQGCLTRRE